MVTIVGRHIRIARAATQASSLRFHATELWRDSIKLTNMKPCLNSVIARVKQRRFNRLAYFSSTR